MLRNVNVSHNGYKYKISMVVVSEAAFLDSVLHIAESVS
jgi:hypothetical protein